GSWRATWTRAATTTTASRPACGASCASVWSAAFQVRWRRPRTLTWTASGWKSLPIRPWATTDPKDAPAKQPARPLIVPFALLKKLYTKLSLKPRQHGGRELKQQRGVSRASDRVILPQAAG